MKIPFSFLCSPLILMSGLLNGTARGEAASPFSFEIKPDRIIDGQYVTTASNGKKIESGRKGKKWELSQEISAYPRFRAENMPLLEAVYNLSVEETKKNTRPLHNSTLPVFNTGTHWNKVWARDTAFSVQYSLGWIDPDTSKASLLEKIQGNPRELMEDTGTGGSYPVSTDRIIIAIAVWEHYLATGDTAYLEKMYDVLKYTAEKDIHVTYDPVTGLFKGETSGLDHRRETYPVWMDEGYFSDIAQSKSAGTNIFYAVMFKVLADSSDILGKGETACWESRYQDLKKAINENFWMPEKGAYASWQYPEYMGNPLPDKIDVIANGYAVYYGIADEEQAKKIMENYPLVKYGANTVYPQKPDVAAVYHNRGVWPGWEGALMLGARKAGNNRLAEEIVKSNLYNAAMSLSNYEVVNYKTGEGICSTQQLWSIASALASYYRVLFGMEYTRDGIRFSPFVPSFVKGPLTLDNYRYRDSILDITVTGTGDRIGRMTVDGTIVSDPGKFALKADGKNHRIQVELTGAGPESPVNLKEENLLVCPDIPLMTFSDGKLRWTPDERFGYRLWTGREYVDVTGKSEYQVPQDQYGAYSLIAVTKDGVQSEFSSPVVFNPKGTVLEYEMEDERVSSTSLPRASEIKGYSGSGYLIDCAGGGSSRTSTEVTVDVPESGDYRITFLYNNGDGGVVGTISRNHCGIRSLLVDGKDVGTVLFSTTFKDKFYPSTGLRVPLEKGKHRLTLGYNIDGGKNEKSYDVNMNIKKNDVYLDKLKMELIKKKQDEIRG